MNRTRYLLTATFLLCFIIGICLGTMLPKQDEKDNKLTNGLINSNKEHKGTKKLDKEAVIMKDKEELMKQNASQKDDIQDELELTKFILNENNPEKLHQKLNNYPVETIIDTIDISRLKINELFYSKTISDDIKKRIVGKSYSDSCNIPFSDLRYIRVLHKGFDKKTHIGELIVNKAIEKDCLDIFKELYANDYPIEKMVLIDEYNADDNASMKENNSSAFCYRCIDSTTKISIHSYGLAIDINPRYNPYIREISGKTVVLPENGLDYVDRNKDNKYYIKAGDICYRAFINRGFTWGGDWKNSKDYQHFQKSIE